METNRQKKLLIIVAVLVVFKFVVLPFLAHLDALQEELVDAREKLLQRQKAIAEVELMKQQESALEEKLSTLKSKFSVGPDHEIMQLTFQKKLETRARQYDVVLNNISWTKTYEGAPVIAELELKFEAPFKNLMKFHSAISEVGFSVVTSELFTNVLNQRINWKKLGQAKGTMRLRIYYLVEE